MLVWNCFSWSGSTAEHGGDPGLAGTAMAEALATAALSQGLHRDAEMPWGRQFCDVLGELQTASQPVSVPGSAGIAVGFL